MENKIYPFNGNGEEEKILPAAVICEYNPFHSGHMYHLAMTRRLHGATHIVAVMSGSFVQRGDCAVYSKQTRTRAALAGGADLVVELPLPWCMATAERFASGGVALAAALCQGGLLSFGSECGDMGRISAAAALLGDPRLYERARALQKDGMSFAPARSQAAHELAGDDVASLLDAPNDILAVEYVRAIERLGAGLRPVCVKRAGAMHDSDTPTAEGGFRSASRLRADIRSSGGGALPESVYAGIPDEMIPIYSEIYSESTVMDLGRIDRFIAAKLRLMSRERLAALPDVSEGLENRLYAAAGKASGFDELCRLVKCKRYAMSRVRRVILSALLDIPAGLEKQSPPYIRLLGMNARGEQLVRRGFALPVVAGCRDAAALSGTAREVYELNARACEIFAMCAEQPPERGFDFSGGVIKR